MSTPPAPTGPDEPNGAPMGPPYEAPSVNRGMLVSVVIPAFNAERFVAETIESVAAQTYTDLEIIVVDDGSTDGTRDVVKQMQARDARVKLLGQPNSGVSVARNAGAALSRGGLLAFLDADDTLAPDSVELRVRKLAFDESFGLVHCDYQKVDANSKRIGGPQSFPNEGWILDDLLLPDGSTTVFAIGGCLVRREVFERVGGFDPELSNSADHEFYFRVARHSRIGRVPQVGMFYRVHSSNMSSDIGLLEKDLLTAFRKVDQNRLFRDSSFRSKSYGNMYLELAGSWWINGNNPWRGGRYILKSLMAYPPNIVRLLKKLWYGRSSQYAPSRRI